MNVMKGIRIGPSSDKSFVNDNSGRYPEMIEERIVGVDHKQN